MKLVIDSLAIVDHAEIDLDGITVIAGENNVGKSTLGKALFALVNSFSNVFSSPEEEVVRSLNQTFRRFYEQQTIIAENNGQLVLDIQDTMSSDRVRMAGLGFSLAGLSRDMTAKLRFHATPDAVKSFIEGYIPSDIRQRIFDQFRTFVLSGENRDFLDRCVRLLSLSDDSFSMAFSERTFGSVFDRQISSRIIGTGENPDIRLVNSDGAELIHTQFSGEKCVSSLSHIGSETRAVLLDDPNVIDGYADEYHGVARRSMMPGGLLKHLILKTDEDENVAESILAQQDAQHFLNILDRAYQGKLDQNGNKEWVLSDARKMTEPIKTSNSSKGSKAIAVLRALVDESVIRAGDFLILDEPEIHLHPEWQIVYAEALVLLSKELGVRLMITSHSPYFIEAIETFASTYDYSDKSGMYVSDRAENGSVTFVRANEDQKAQIFEKMAAPFDTLEQVRADKMFGK